MALSALMGQLKRVGQMLNRWMAEFRLTVGLTAVIVLFFVMTLTDLLTRYSRGGRFLAWGVLVALCAVLTGLVMKTLARRRSPESVAVCVEHTFPELDNHLINFLQFSATSVRDAFVAAYVRMEIPHWNTLDFSRMKDRRTLRRAQLALGLATVLLLVPLPFLGRAWTVAMVRILNPFSDVAPVSLTSILDVSPGDATVRQGDDVRLSCKVRGKSGHEVHLDLRPADGEQKTYNLGALKGGEEQLFNYDLFKVTTAMKYRFRAGDAYVDGWNEITLRPPLAFSSVSLRVAPPAYMGIRPAVYDTQSKAIEIPVGSRVSLATECNTPLRSLQLSGLGGTRQLTLSADKRGGSAELVVSNGVALVLAAAALNGDEVEATLGFNLLPDRPPSLTVKSPRQPVPLPPGAAPAIDFSVSDDFGFSEIRIEQLSASGDGSEPVKVLKTYSGSEVVGRELSFLWKGDVRRIHDTGAMLLRVVARDNRAGEGNVTVSPTLVFDLDEASKLAREREDEAKKSADGLSRVIELQRENIGRTRELRGALNAAVAEQWNEAAERQDMIRQIVRLLIEKGGVRALGNLVATVKKLYVNEMFDAVTALRRVPSLRDEAARERQITQALALQEKILRQLTFAGESARKTQESQSSSTLIGMIDGIINRQVEIIKTTSRCATQQVDVAASVIDDQDKLGSEIIAFAKACRAQAQAGQGEAKDQSVFLESLAAFCEKEKIQNDMLLAAESLEDKALSAAMRHQRTAYNKLLTVRQRFEEVQAQDEKETREEMIQALQIAGAKLDKLKAIEKQLREEMDKIAENVDKNTEDFDIMEEEAAEIRKNIEEALLQIPRDLDIFAHLHVGNDLVEDVYSVFEEVEQEEGSGKTDPDGAPVAEKAVIKREYLAEVMEKTDELFDTFEMWLGKDPDSTKVTVEAMDQEEMPEGVALTPLQTSMEDIIGDLLEIDEELDRQADDGAINAAVPDDPAIGAEITEGDTTTFSAKGKSGNETPDHKEQDGRSNVGRQGMSSGESAAGSGTIGEGDDDIEKRRTQDPTQSGQVTADGEADTKATGGGKLGDGKGDDWGDTGGTERMDASEAGSWAETLENMSRKADQAYAQASLKGLRTDSLEAAAHHIRQAADAVSKGVPINQVAELRRRAIGMLQKAKTELGEGSAANLDGESLTSTLSDVVEAGQELAPEKYRELNADYYKKLNEVM